MNVLSIQKAQQLAVEHGLTLCDHCELPMEQHFGFNHGEGKCIVPADNLCMSMRYPDEKARAEVITRINKYNDAHQAAEDAHQDAEDAKLNRGAGI